MAACSMAGSSLGVLRDSGSGSPARAGPRVYVSWRNGSFKLSTISAQDAADRAAFPAQRQHRGLESRVALRLARARTSFLRASGPV